MYFIALLNVCLLVTVQCTFSFETLFLGACFFPPVVHVSCPNPSSFNLSMNLSAPSTFALSIRPDTGSEEQGTSRCCTALLGVSSCSVVWNSMILSELRVKKVSSGEHAKAQDGINAHFCSKLYFITGHALSSTSVVMTVWQLSLQILFPSARRSKYNYNKHK